MQTNNSQITTTPAGTVAPKEKTVIFINNTALGYLFTCRRLYQIVCLYGYKPPPNKFLTTGKDFHEFAAMYSRGAEPRALAEHVAKTTDRNVAMAKLAFGLSPDNILTLNNGEKAIELYFDSVIFENDNYILKASGTIDRIDYDESGVIRIIDYKTAWTPRVQEVLGKYETHFQIPWYLYVLKHGLKDRLRPEDAKKIDDNLFYGKYYGVFLTANPVKFEFSSMIQLTPSLERWIESIMRTAVYEIMNLLSSPNLAEPTGMVNDSCHRCWLCNICQHTRDDDKIRILLSSLKSEPYDPRTW